MFKFENFQVEIELQSQSAIKFFNFKRAISKFHPSSPTKQETSLSPFPKHCYENSTFLKIELKPLHRNRNESHLVSSSIPFEIANNTSIPVSDGTK